MSNRDSRKHKQGEKQNEAIWLYGKHAAIAALSNPRRKILRVLATPNLIPELEKFKGVIAIESVDVRTIEAFLPKEATHQGIAVQARPMDEADIEDIFSLDFAESKEKSVVVLLDHVTDPHNVGAIMRSAAAFNAAAVVMTKDNSPKESTALAKAASGALETVPLVKVTNLVAAMKYLKDCGFWCIGLDANAEKTISEIKGYDKVALVMGAEGKGLRRLTEENCDLMAALPISDKVESLNVSNATAIALYEMAK